MKPDEQNAMVVVVAQMMMIEDIKSTIMRKGFGSLYRWHTMIFARALIFAISSVLLSSGDVIVVPRDDARMLRQGDGGGAVEPPLEWSDIRVLESRSAKSKSAKVGSKSGKGSKSKAAKSKSGKSKSAKAKSAKTKSAKTKSSKTKSAKSMPYAKLGKSGSKKSVYSHMSEDSFDSESSKSNEISFSDTETENIAFPTEDETIVGTHAASTETSSVLESTADGSVTSNDDNHSTSGMEEAVGSPRSDVTTSSSDGVQSNRTEDDVMMHVENEVVQEVVNLEGGLVEERIAEGTNDDENHDNGSSDSSSHEEIDGITSEPPLGQVSTEVTNLELESIEAKIEEDETMEKFVETEAVLDLSRESLE